MGALRNGLALSLCPCLDARSGLDLLDKKIPVDPHDQIVTDLAARLLRQLDEKIRRQFPLGSVIEEIFAHRIPVALASQ
jgi:hypothetical protein